MTTETNRVTITAKDLPAAILVEGGKLAERELNRIHAFIKEVNDGNRDIVLIMETPAGVKITINPIGPSDPPEVITEDELAKIITTYDDAVDERFLAAKLLETFSITKKS
jgi:hypothetical protein